MRKIKLNIAGKRVSLDFNEHFAQLTKINESLNLGAAENYRKMGLTYVDVPELVGITGACENIDTLFKIQNSLDLPLFFTQTGQLALEQALQSCHGVYTVIHSGRDETKEDKRHLRQFRLTEEEFDCTLAGMRRNNYDEEKMFEVLLHHIQKTIQAMIKRILKDNKEVFKKTYQCQLEEPEKVSKTDFLRITYEKAIGLLNKNGFKNLKFGDDLEARHEAKVVELLNNNKKKLPVFITKYPKEIKFFNMKVYTKDPRVVLSADLILPYAGEVVGSAVREYDFKKLRERLITSMMYKLHLQRGGKYEDFLWYLNIIKNKTTYPHGGYGVGNERVLQYIFAESDIRNVSLFSLLDKQSGDWSKKRYGQAAIFSPDKKHVLLSIGRVEHKKFLLPYIKQIVKNHKFIVYATKGTHQFLKKHKVKTSFVYKISAIGEKPNIADLLDERVFDLIINIPTRIKITTGKEFTDGKLIRKGAIEKGVCLITDLEVAVMVIHNLVNKKE